jgi:hypothetical protein
MSITRRAIGDLDQASVQAILTDMQARLQAAFPGIDFRRGVYHDRVLYLAAVLAAGDQDLIDRIVRSQSLYDIALDPELADDELVDRVLSNFRVARKAGSAAGGTITIVMSQAYPTTVQLAATFTIGDVQVRATQATAVRLSSAQVTADSDRVLVRQPDGNYAFTISAQAVEAGTAGMLRRGATAVPDDPPPYFVRAYVQDDWGGGADTEDNATLIARLQAGIAAPTFSNRITTAAMIVGQPQFADIRALSFIGAGDVELGRARHTIFPIGLSGYCDVYVRAGALPQRTTLTKTATLVQKTANGGVWQFEIARDDAPGFYEVLQIIRAGGDPSTNGYGIVSDVRGIDTVGVASPPDMKYPLEAAYSAFQTAVIQFLDGDTPTGGLTVSSSTRDYSVTVGGQVKLADLQAYLSSRKVTWPSGDVLVRGAIPCRVRLQFNVYVRPGTAAIDAGAIARRLADTVNATGFVGQLYSSTLIEAISDLIPPGAALGPIDMFGKIRRPDGKALYVRDPVLLTLPNDPGGSVTPRTAIFILDEADVSVNVTNVALPEV